MARQKITITEFMDEAAIDGLRDMFDVHFDPALGDAPERLYPLLEDVDGLIVRTATQVGTELLQSAPKLQCIGRLGVGLDNFDLEACERFSVRVYPAIGANAHSVAEYVLTTSAILLRKGYGRNDEMIAGNWPRTASRGDEISGKHLGIVGYGSIGRLTSALALNMGLKVRAFDPYVEAGDTAWGEVKKVASLKELLSWADIVSLHVPLTDETRGMIGAHEIAGMKSSGVLINAARGGVVSEPALAAALRKGEISGAALDVFEKEPLSADDAKIFQGVPGLILTPHIAGVTVQSNERVSAMAADQVRKHLLGG